MALPRMCCRQSGNTVGKVIVIYAIACMPVLLPHRLAHKLDALANGGVGIVDQRFDFAGGFHPGVYMGCLVTKNPR